jgi:hypothetical protein
VDLKRLGKPVFRLVEVFPELSLRAQGLLEECFSLFAFLRAKVDYLHERFFSVGLDKSGCSHELGGRGGMSPAAISSKLWPCCLSMEARLRDSVSLGSCGSPLLNG